MTLEREELIAAAGPDGDNLSRVSQTTAEAPPGPEGTQVPGFRGSQGDQSVMPLADPPPRVPLPPRETHSQHHLLGLLVCSTMSPNQGAGPTFQKSPALLSLSLLEKRRGLGLPHPSPAIRPGTYSPTFNKGKVPNLKIALKPFSEVYTSGYTFIKLWLSSVMYGCE